MSKRCLILDQDQDHAIALESACGALGFSIQRVSTVAEARIALADSHVVVAFVDLNIGEDGGGLTLLEDGSLSAVESLVMSSHDDPALADKAIKLGASYFFCKPFSPEMIAGILQDIADEAEPSQPAENDGHDCAVDQYGLLRGSSRSMRKLYRSIRKVAHTDASLMIVGESGTGKDLVAQTTHKLSARSEGPFIAFNCAAVAENLAESELFGHEKGSFSGAHSRHRGFFEQAHGGTLFLDEITEMDIGLQAKLLRVLENKTLQRLGAEGSIEIDVRFISATNRSPEQAVEDGKLREDLYYRLAQFPIRVPPLRQREGDICGLSQFFLNSLNEKHETDIQFTEGALEAIKERSWPGNVRELKNYVERAYIMAESVIDSDALPESGRNLSTEDLQATASGDKTTIAHGATLANAEKKLILASLERNQGDKKSTAEELGISLKTLYNRLKDYEEELDIAVDRSASAG